ncbi:MAG: ATP-binding protein [Cellulomonas sp.]|nr:ATP-binding protein [Cellulomonas sp.]
MASIGPLVSGNAATLTARQIDEWRVGRETEIAALLPPLRASCNVYLWGERGIGKTFLVRLLQKALQDEAATLAVNVSATAHLHGGYGTVVDVASGTVLAILEKVWTDVVGRDYSELRATLSIAAADGKLRSLFRSDLEQTAVQLYREVMASERRLHFRRNSSIGASAIAKGEYGRDREVELSTPAIMPFEFVEFTHELVVALSAVGVDRLTIFLDEANVLDDSTQNAFLSQYIELFASSSTNFLFVAGVDKLEPEHVPREGSFDVLARVSGLDAGSSFKLVAKAAERHGIAISEDLARLIITHSAGSPRILLFLVSEFAGYDYGGRAVSQEAVQHAIMSAFESRRSIPRTIFSEIEDPPGLF